MPQRFIETLVGFFLLLMLIAFSLLALKVSGLTNFFPESSYTITAAFDDIGSLKPRSAVKIGGVQIGEVTGIELDPITFKAKVSMRIVNKYNDIPDDSSARILTAGLLGDNYISLTPMYNKSFLKNGSEIQFTNSAMILEKLIGQFIYKIGNGSGNTDDKSVAKSDSEAIDTNLEVNKNVKE